MSLCRASLSYVQKPISSYAVGQFSSISSGSSLHGRPQVNVSSQFTVLTYWTLDILLLLWKAPCHWWGEQAHQYTHPEFSDPMGAWSYQHSRRETAHERLVICHLATHKHTPLDALSRDTHSTQSAVVCVDCSEGYGPMHTVCPFRAPTR